MVTGLAGDFGAPTVLDLLIVWIYRLPPQLLTCDELFVGGALGCR